MFLDYQTPLLRGGESGVLQLIATACRLRQWHQQVRFAEGEPLVERVGAGARDHQIGCGDDVSPTVADVFALDVVGFARKCGIDLARPAHVYHHATLQQVVQRRGHRFVEGSRTQTAADHQQHSSATAHSLVDTEQSSAAFGIALEQVLAQRPCRSPPRACARPWRP